MNSRPLPVASEDPASGLWGYRDADGAWQIAPVFALAGDFTMGGIASVADPRGWRYIDRAGRTVVARPFIVDNGPDGFTEGVARCWTDEGVAFFDDAGRVVLKTTYAYAEPFAEGLALVCDGCRRELDGEHERWVDGRWGFIARSGEVVIPCRYDEATSFDEGTARAKLGGQWFTIDRVGRVVGD